MNRNDVCKTAHWIAAVRAFETQSEAPLFRDPYAERLAGTIGKQLQIGSESASKSQFIIVRTKYFDDFIGASSVDCSQVVLLGSGFDARAYRLDLNSAKIFELDHSEVMSQKEKVLGSERPKNGNTVVRISADLREDWIEKLQRKGFDISIPTVWVLEGLLYYLSASTVKEIIESINQCSVAGSRVVYDVFGTGLLALKEISAFIENQKRKGAVLPYCNDQPEELFSEFKEWNLTVDYCGSETANYGRVKKFHQDLSKPDRAALNSYFIYGIKSG